MNFSYSTKKMTACDTNAEALLVFYTRGKLSESAKLIDSAYGGALSKQLDKKKLKDGQSLSLTLTHADSAGAQTIHLLALGEAKDKKTVSIAALSKCLGAAIPKIISEPAKELAIFTDELSLDHEDTHIAHVFCTEFERAAYKYSSTFGTQKTERRILKRIAFAAQESAQTKKIRSAISQGTALAQGINFARELGNLPGNHCTPKHLSNFAKALAAEHPSLSVKIIGERAMEKLKMGSLLSVSHGSEEEAQLIVFEYKGKSSAKPNVIVGKGITFDTGGISLKPGGAMDEMKFDMCGAASVFGTIKALAEMKAKAHVIGVVAAAENMPSGRATKPGDVVTSMSGQTIEILNTDAEGRLVLCDALTYVERFKPKTVVDIATLTGACVVALGRHATGLFSNNQALADKLLLAGEHTNDRAWQMPIWEEYQPSLKSNFADMANIGGREAGSVTAACFLSKFTKAYPWAHLDIAGTAWMSGAAKGATGRPVSLLVRYLLDNA